MPDPVRVRVECLACGDYHESVVIKWQGVGPGRWPRVIRRLDPPCEALKAADERTDELIAGAGRSFAQNVASGAPDLAERALEAALFLADEDGSS